MVLFRRTPFTSETESGSLGVAFLAAKTTVSYDPPQTD